MAKPEHRSVLVASDLTSSRRWDTPVQPSDDDWLASVARLRPEQFVLRADAGVASGDSDEPLLTRDIDGWRTGRYIGEIRHQGRTLRIRPRLGVQVIGEWMSAAHNVAVLPRAAGKGRDTQTLLIQLVAAMWRASVLDAGRHALARRRVEQRHVGDRIRGRLDVHGTARLRAVGDGRVASTSRDRALDTTTAAAIVRCDRVLDRHLADTRWRGDRLEDILHTMRAAVGSRPALPSRDDLARVRYSPIAARWRPAADLSRRIATLDLLTTSAEDDSTYGALVDVAELWELFLLRCLTDATAETVTHGTRTAIDRHLLTSTADPARGLGRLYPDLFVGPPKEPLVVIDAKYKRHRYPEDVAREDLYQLAAYASAFRPRRAMLAYPEVETAEDRGDEGAWTNAEGTRFEFHRVPVRRGSCTDWFQTWLSRDADTGSAEERPRPARTV